MRANYDSPAFLNQKMKLKLFNLAVFVVFSTLIFAGCRPNSSVEVKNGIGVTDADGKTVIINDSSRIVAVGTAVTETIYALGAGAKVVGVDSSSAEYVSESANLPKIGARTTLSAEGILSLKPTLVIANADSGSPQVIEQLRNSGITVLTLTPNYTVETVKSKIEIIAHALGADAKGKEINAAVDSDLNEVAKMLEKKKSTPKVLFVGRGPNMPNATMSGAGTTIEQMIQLAGGTNPVKDFTGFREMTDEAVVALQPDIILLGFEVEKVKRQAVVLVALAVGASVAFTGLITFVGLIVPHLLRLIIGPDHRYLFPASALLGASLLLTADLIARTLVAPAEMPIGVLTAMLGAPFFLWLLLHDGQRSLKQ